ncbi:MAG: hypothetical protein CMP39_02455 [Rickettsiales bacterium]|nr:hypothetical protein [Rickettsiales bacterium]
MQFTNAQQSALRYDRNIIVEAGAGSGKTAVFVQRYLNILSENPDILPENILAITFTNKAAHECMERIRKHILGQKDDVGLWLEHLSRAHISTIHGFCSYLIKHYCLSLNLPFNFGIVDEQDRSYFFQMAIKETLSKLAEEANQDFKLYISTFSIQRLQQDLELVFQNNTHFQKHVDTIRFLPNQTESDQLLLTLASLFERVNGTFKGLKKRLNLLDYDDLLSHFEDLLDNTFLRQLLQKQFKFIMVDECQDIDPKQWESIQRLVTDLNPLSGQKLFLVGDAKQSIYGFRGADLRFFSMLSSSFAQHPTTCSTVYLNDNFRTCSAILNFLNPMFNRLFETGTDHAVEYHPLVPFRDTQGQVTCMLLKDAQSSNDEIKGLYYWINQYLSDHPSYSYSDIAILCRQRKQCYKIKTELEKLGLPIHLDREPGFFQEQVVIDLFQLIKALCLPNDSLAWITVFKSPIFGFNANLIHLFFNHTSSTRFLGKLNECLNWNKDYYNNFDLADDEIVIFSSGLKLLRHYLSFRHDSRLAIILKRILTESGAYSLYCTRSYSNLTFIEQFLEIVDQLESQRFISRFELIERLEYKLKTTQTSLQNIDTDQESIQIMTIHSSKGLEFPIVICPELHAPFSVKKSTPLLITSHAVHLTVGESSEDPIRSALLNELTIQNIEEEKRLFYVACTRARDTLVLSGLTDSKHYQKPCYLRFLYDTYEANDQHTCLKLKENQPSPHVELINQLSELKQVDIPSKNVTETQLKSDFNVIDSSSTDLNQIQFTSLSKLEYSTQHHSKNFSADLKERHENSLMVDKSAYFGVLIHKLLRDLFDVGPWDMTFLNYFILKNKLKSTCSPAQLEQVKSHFSTCLHSNFLQSISRFPLEFEKEFSIFYNQKIIRGRYDCLVQRKEDIVIIDFKTESFKDKLEQDIIEKYQLQTDIYLKAAKQQFKTSIKPIKLIFYSTCDDAFISIEG